MKGSGGQTFCFFEFEWFPFNFLKLQILHRLVISCLLSIYIILQHYYFIVYFAALFCLLPLEYLNIFLSHTTTNAILAYRKQWMEGYPNEFFANP